MGNPINLEIQSRFGPPLAWVGFPTATFSQLFVAFLHSPDLPLDTSVPMGGGRLALQETTLRQPWSRSAPPSLPCASGTGGLRNDKHGSTPSQGRSGNLSSRTRPPSHIRSQAPPHCPCPPSISGLQAPLGGARPRAFQAPLLSLWSIVMTKGTTPAMGYWDPLTRIVEWPREDGSDVRAFQAAS